MAPVILAPLVIDQMRTYAEGRRYVKRQSNRTRRVNDARIIAEGFDDVEILVRQGFRDAQEYREDRAREDEFDLSIGYSYADTLLEDRLNEEWDNAHRCSHGLVLCRDCFCGHCGDRRC